MPGPVKDHWKLYWWAWLMPDRAYDGFEYGDKKYNFAQGYIGGKDMQAYQDATKDWRGNTSVYRTYVRDMGTMNFNHWATAGVLLGGNILGDEKMMAAGRYGLENIPAATVELVRRQHAGKHRSLLLCGVPHRAEGLRRLRPHARRTGSWAKAS